MKFSLNYDKNFRPLSIEFENFQKEVELADNEEVGFAIENGNCNYVRFLKVFKEERFRKRNYLILERLIKSALWVVGGYKIYLTAPDYLFRAVSKDYSKTGKRAFDVNFMSDVYDKPFEVVKVLKEELPAAQTAGSEVKKAKEGYRIGFDAGGSDRKVSAISNGKVVYSEEVVWHPKLSKDWRYQRDEIKTAIKTAASKLPKVDSIGISTAGVVIDGRLMVSSLFIKVPHEDFDNHVKYIYLDIAQELGVPVKVVNDGDAAALAGAEAFSDVRLLGIAMGTSEAGGYVNENGGLNGWLNELAFVPIDVGYKTPMDDWSKDFGTGSKYFSQDGVIRLAEAAGVEFSKGLTLFSKLEKVQKAAESGNAAMKRIFEDIGVYLGYAIPWYAEFYKINRLLLLGRVTTGISGEIILESAKRVLDCEFQGRFKVLTVCLPDENFKRIGQSVAVAFIS